MYGKQSFRIVDIPTGKSHTGRFVGGLYYTEDLIGPVAEVFLESILGIKSCVYVIEDADLKWEWKNRGNYIRIWETSKGIEKAFGIKTNESCLSLYEIYGTEMRKFPSKTVRYEFIRNFKDRYNALYYIAMLVKF